jgi:hypothetical protein
MSRLLRVFVLTLVLSVLIGCGATTHPINPPNASIQQLNVLADGSWRIQIRIENFSDLTQHYSTFKAALRVADIAAADISLNPEIDIPGENADIVETTLAPNADARKAFLSGVKEPSGAEYELKGTIVIPKADKEFKFEHKSHLSPTPGVPDQYR